MTPGFTRAMPPVVEDGWQPLVDEMSHLVGLAQALLEQTGGRLAGGWPLTLGAELNDAERKLGELRAPEQRPELPGSPVVDELDAVREALASVAAAKAPVGEVIAEVNTALYEQTTAALGRRRALRAALDLAEETEPVVNELPSRPQSAAETSEFTQAIGAAQQRQTWLRQLEDETSELFDRATAEVDCRRQRVEDAERLVSDARVLVPHLNGEQASLRGQMDRATGNLENIRPSWWRASGTALTTTEEVEAARQTRDPSLPERLDRAAAGLEASVAQLIAVIDGNEWLRKVYDLQNAASQAQDLLPLSRLAAYGAADGDAGGPRPVGRRRANPTADGPGR